MKIVQKMICDGVEHIQTVTIENGELTEDVVIRDPEHENDPSMEDLDPHFYEKFKKEADKLFKVDSHINSYIVWASDDAGEWVFISNWKTLEEALMDMEQPYSYVIITGGAIWAKEGTENTIPMPVIPIN